MGSLQGDCGEVRTGSPQLTDMEKKDKDKPTVTYGFRCRCPALDHDPPRCLQKAKEDGYDLVVVEGMLNYVNFPKILARLEKQTNEERLLESQSWNDGILCMLTDVNEELWGPDLALNRMASLRLREELEAAKKLMPKGLVLELKQFQDYRSLLRFALHMTRDTKMSLWVKLPIAFPHELGNEGEDKGTKGRKKLIHRMELDSAWMMWHKIRSFCKYDRRLRVVLEVPLESVRPDSSESEILLRWLAEPVAGIMIPNSCFSNAGTIMSPSFEHTLNLFCTATDQVFFDPHSPGGASRKNCTDYMQRCLAKFWKADRIDSICNYRGAMYDLFHRLSHKDEDVLNVPLQPLRDHLENATYQEFELDITKYNLYEEAIYTALMDMSLREEEEEKSDEDGTRTIVLMVLGAGRGPIVDRALKAGVRAHQQLKVYAIDKNTGVMETLNSKNENDWGGAVTVVHVDMREWNAPEQADVIVSELLGSFGDNELSPECLDGAQKVLKEGGLMIPQSYTSFLAPVMSPKVKVALENRELVNYLPVNERKSILPHPFEMLYGIHLYQHYVISEPQPLFTFHHPRTGPSPSNERYGHLTFKAKIDSMLNGFAGYFECILYKDVKMSIVPSTFTKGMWSWYPVFFPIQGTITNPWRTVKPVVVKRGDEIDVLLKRCVGKKSVWYEWRMESPQVVPTHNAGGHAYDIGLPSHEPDAA